MEQNKRRIQLDVWPVWEDNTIKTAKIQMVLSGYYAKAGEKIFTFMEEEYHIPSNVNWEQFTLLDESGELPYQCESERIQHKVEKRVFVQRDTKGKLQVNYTADYLPARPNPVMDMGYEYHGIVGTGSTWLPTFLEGEFTADITFHKDYVPKDCRMLCGYGEDNIYVTLQPDELANVFYCFGKVKAVEAQNFGYYWFDREGFDATEIGEWTRDAFLKVANFFEDKKEPYKIFARARTCKHSGGTAANRSYTYIYNPENLPDFTSLKFLFLHEMVHNWIGLCDTPYGTCTWYVEGIAEYYSVVLPWRFGFVTREELKQQLQSKINQYYENPCRLLPNKQLGNLLFQDFEATDVPYGRGMFYLMQADKRIREKTNNKKNLDHVMRNIIKQYQQDNTLKNHAWLKAMEEEAGLDETEPLLLLSQGELISPEFSCFEGANFIIEEKQTVTRREAEPCISYTIK